MQRRTLIFVIIYFIINIIGFNGSVNAGDYIGNCKKNQVPYPSTKFATYWNATGETLILYMAGPISPCSYGTIEWNRKTTFRGLSVMNTQGTLLYEIDQTGSMHMGGPIVVLHENSYEVSGYNILKNR